MTVLDKFQNFQVSLTELTWKRALDWHFCSVSFFMHRFLIVVQSSAAPRTHNTLLLCVVDLLHIWCPQFPFNCTLALQYRMMKKESPLDVVILVTPWMLSEGLWKNDSRDVKTKTTSHKVKK